MREESALRSELQTIGSVIGIAGNPPKQAQLRTVSECAATAITILRHIASAEEAASASKLRPRLRDEAIGLLVTIKQHVCEIARQASAQPEMVLSADVPIHEGLSEQFEDLRDKCCYPLMDVVERISAGLEGPAPPADAISLELATKLFCVTRYALIRAVRDGQLKSYRDPHQPKGGGKRLSKGQVAKLYDRRP